MKIKNYGYGGMSKKKAGGASMVGDLNKDGVLSGYEKNRDAAIKEAIAKQARAKLGRQTGKPALVSSMNGYEMKHGGSCGKVRKASYYRKGKK